MRTSPPNPLVQTVLPERLLGFEGAVYHDRLTDPRPQRHGAQPIRLTGETDRIYLPPSAATTIDDLRHGRRISIRQDGSGRHRRLESVDRQGTRHGRLRRGGMDRHGVPGALHCRRLRHKTRPGRGTP